MVIFLNSYDPLQLNFKLKIIILFSVRRKGKKCSFPGVLRLRKALEDKVKWSANEKGSKRRFYFQQGAAGQAQLQEGMQTLNA